MIRRARLVKWASFEGAARRRSSGELRARARESGPATRGQAVAQSGQTPRARLVGARGEGAAPMGSEMTGAEGVFVRVSVELLPDAPGAEVLTAIRAADESAIDTVFCVDEIYHRDAWGILAAAARETRRVRLAPG